MSAKLLGVENAVGHYCEQIGLSVRFIQIDIGRIEHHFRTTPELAAELGLEVTRTDDLVASLRILGLVDAAGRINQRGQLELDAQKRGLRRTTADLEGSEAAYYPHSLK